MCSSSSGVRKAAAAQLPAHADVSRSAVALLRRPSFGDQRHADAEFAAQPDARQCDRPADPNTSCATAHRPVNRENIRMVIVSTRIRPKRSLRWPKITPPSTAPISVQ